MSDTDDRGKFSTDIAQAVIDEALRSVKRHTTGESIDDAPTETEVPIVTEGEEPSSTAELTAQLELSQEKGREMLERVKDAHEKMLRAVADLENYKKRAAKERDEAARFGSEKLLKDLLPVVDNLDRALEHAHSAADFDSLKQGVSMTRKLFEDALGKHGVKAFVSIGKTFDPRFHEAMQQVETTDVPPNQVVGEILRGFTLNDRLVRPSLVMVSKAKATDPPKASVGESTET